MVYNTGPEGIDYVRVMTGNLLPEDTTNDLITANLELAYSEVCLISHRTLDDPYPVTAVESGYCKMLEALIAAMLCLKAYGPEFETKVKELQDEITLKEELFATHAVIPETTAEVAEAEALITHTSYKSSGLNCSVKAPNRMRRCASCGSIECQCVGTRAYDHCV